MTTVDQISKLIHASFPVDPLPDEFWLAGAIRRPLDDIAEELQKRIAERPWVEITIRDWAMTGVSTDIVRRYLTPNAFRYYLPSLLVGALRDTGYVDWALDSILPANHKRRPKGEWWEEYSGGFSARQRTAVCAFVEGIRVLFWDNIGPAAQQQIVDAEAFWLASESPDSSDS
jgi:hypothetical protein